MYFKQLLTSLVSRLYFLTGRLAMLLTVTAISQEQQKIDKKSNKTPTWKICPYSDILRKMNTFPHLI